MVHPKSPKRPSPYNVPVKNVPPLPAIPEESSTLDVYYTRAPTLVYPVTFAM